MSDFEEKRARELMAKAEAILKRWSFFSSSNKYGDAGELYAKAANNYKIAKNWKSASDCYIKAADMSVKSGSQFDSARNYVLAAEMLANLRSGDAISLYLQAIDIFGELGKFAMAARHLETVAEIYETEQKIPEAVNHFQRAVSMYEGDNSKARAAKCLEKVAFLSAKTEKYDVALANFEKLGIASLDNNLLKFSAKKHFFHALMCAMAGNDIVASRNCFNRYSELDYSFGSSAEGKLMQDLLEALDEKDQSLFSDKLFQFDSIRRLDPWETSVFLAIKNLIEPEALEFSLGEDLK